MVVVGDVLHDIFHRAVEDVAQLVDGVCFHVLVVSETVELRAVYIVVCVEVILGDTLFLHGLP